MSSSPSPLPRRRRLSSTAESPSRIRSISRQQQRRVSAERRQSNASVGETDEQLADSVMANMLLFQEAENMHNQIGRSGSTYSQRSSDSSHNSNSNNDIESMGSPSTRRSHRRRSSGHSRGHDHVVLSPLDEIEETPGESGSQLGTTELATLPEDSSVREFGHDSSEGKLQRPRHLGRASTTSTEFSSDLQVISDIRGRLIIKTIKHRLEYLLFGIGVAALILPIILLFRVTLVDYYRVFFAAGFREEDLTTLATTTTGEDRMIVLGYDMVFYVTAFLVISFPLYYFWGFAVMFSGRFDWKTIPKVSGKIALAVFLAVFTQAVPVLAQVIGGKIAILTPASGGVRVLLTGLCGFVSAKIITDALGFKWKWLPSMVGKVEILKTIAGTAYVVFAPTLFFTLATNDLERALVRIFVHPIFLEFGNSANRMLANLLALEDGRHTALVGVTMQFGFSLYSRMLINNLESVVGQVLLSLFLTFLDASLRINARDMDYHYQNLFHKVKSFVSSICCCCKQTAEGSKESELQETGDSFVDESSDDEIRLAFKSNLNHAPDQYDEYRVFAEICEMVTIIVSACIMIFVRMAPTNTAKHPVSWELQLQSMVAQLGIEFITELAITIGVISLGSKFQQRLIAKEMENEKAQEGTHVSEKSTVTTSGVEPHVMGSAGTADRMASQSMSHSRSRDEQSPKMNHINKVKTAWTGDEKQQQPSLMEQLEEYILRRAAKSFGTTTRLVLAWDNLPWGAFAFIVFSIILYMPLFYTTFIKLAYCSATDSDGLFFVPCARIN